MYYSKTMKLTAMAIALYLPTISSAQATLTWVNWSDSITDPITGHALGAATTTNLTDLKDNVDIVANDLDNTKNALTTTQQEVSSNQTQITNNRALQEKVNTQQATTNNFYEHRLNGLDHDVINLNGRVDRLSDKMNRGLAAQSALSGLFQPYSVGHFNTSLSFGGYESDTALAIGAGYRLNEHVAFKAGLAANTENFKGTAYNAAMNFEW